MTTLHDTPPPAAPRLSARVPGLDLLRAAAIALVVLYHGWKTSLAHGAQDIDGAARNAVGAGAAAGAHATASAAAGAWQSVLDVLSRALAAVAESGWIGVDLFFALSGYLIGLQLLAPLRDGHALALGTFYGRRALRILPAFAVVLALYACLPSLREAPTLAPWWQYATFTFNLLVHYDPSVAFIHAWSLCVEEHFYLAFPLLAWWLSRHASVQGVVALSVAVVVLGILLRLVLWAHGASMPGTRNWVAEDLYLPTWSRLDGLLAGVLLAATQVHRPALWSWLQRHGNLLAALGLVLFAAGAWLFRDRGSLAGNTIGWPLLALGAALLVPAASSRSSLLGRWRLPGVAWVATLSYSVYLSHLIALHAVAGIGNGALLGRGAITAAVDVSAVLLAGALLHYAVERPVLRRRDRWLMPRPLPIATAR